MIGCLPEMFRDQLIGNIESFEFTIKVITWRLSVLSFAEKKFDAASLSRKFGGFQQSLASALHSRELWGSGRSL